MSVLADRELSQMYPDSPHIQPASIDLHIGTSLLVWPDYVRRDPRTDQSHVWRTEPFDHELEGVWVLRPGRRYLAATAERVAITDQHAGQIAGRSSWGRDGLSVIIGPAGWIDPGFVGHIVLELTVTGSELVIWPGASIAQLVMHELSTPAYRPYGHPSRTSKYQGQASATPSLFHREAVTS